MSKTGIGYAYAFIAYSLWGLLPVYWKLLSFANPYEILSHRILWSFVFALLLIIVLKRENPLILLRKKKNILIVAATGVTISINWLVYIYAINSGFIVEASLGYYINPLVSVFLGVFFLKEKLAALQKIALVLSAAGVAYLTVRYGKFPWIALGLAFSFAAYGLLKKLFALDTIGSLMLETMFVSPLALGFLIFGAFSGSGPWASHFLYRLPLSPVLFAACGIVQPLLGTPVCGRGVHDASAPFTLHCTSLPDAHVGRQRLESRRSGFRSGDRRGLQNRLRGSDPVVGGFDSHVAPPLLRGLPRADA